MSEENMNEKRADWAQRALLTFPDTDQNDGETAVTDMLADVAHLCDRLGLAPDEVFAAGLRSYRGDLEDGPQALHRLDSANIIEEA